MLLTQLVVDGLIACVPFAILVWTSFLMRPRVWLHSLPHDIQARASPKTSGERRLTALLAPLILLAFFGVPIAQTWRLDSATPGGLSFGSAFIHVYGSWMIVNLWDLLMIDWPYAYLVDPHQPPIAGTEGAAGYKDYAFHFRAFVKASVLSPVLLAPAAALIVMIRG